MKPGLHYSVPSEVSFGRDLSTPDFASLLDSVIEPPLPSSIDKMKDMTLPRPRNRVGTTLGSLTLLMLWFYMEGVNQEKTLSCLDCCKMQFFLGRIITAESNTVLDFSDGNYETLPSGLFQSLLDLGVLLEVQSVSFNNSSLKKIERSDFHGIEGSFFTALEVLDFSSNDLKTIPGDVFEGLGSLFEINLSENPINILPSDIFSGQALLENLVLNGNEEMNLKSVFAASSGNVQALFLERIGLSDMLQFQESARQVAPVRLVSHINLRDNKDVKTIPGETFSSNLFPDLQKVVLGGLSINTLPFDLFLGNEDGIQVLDLNACSQMKKLPSLISSLSSLRILKLRFSSVEEIEDLFFSGMSAIESIDLGCTPLGAFLNTKNDVLDFQQRVGLSSPGQVVVIETACDLAGI
eukprot:snap_masked-scaffold_4-processed-gene-6.37-mRNA-1 protein AED:1.00 eAED:1.00 QI:0/0/0/0/1/1/2/0/408